MKMFTADIACPGLAFPTEDEVEAEAREMASSCNPSISDAVLQAMADPNKEAYFPFIRIMAAELLLWRRAVRAAQTYVEHAPPPSPKPDGAE